MTMRILAGPAAENDVGRRTTHRLAVLGAVLLATLGGACAAQDAPAPAPEMAAALEPGTYQSPLVRLKRLQGQGGHLHIDEVKYRESDALLFQCSYTFGVVDAENPAGMSYLAEQLKHTIPNDERTPGCIHLAYDGDIVYTTHRGNLRNPAFLSGWDISQTDPKDPEKMKPAQIPVLQEPDVRYEGLDVANGHIYVAISDDGLGVYHRDPATNVITRTGSLGDIGSTWDVRVRGNTAYLTDLGGNLVTVDVGEATRPKVLGKVATGGVARGLQVDGDYAYVAAGSEGLVIVDVSDPANPEVVGKAPTLGSAIRVDVSDGHAFVAAWNDARVYDVADPSKPTFIGAVRLTTDANYPDGEGHAPITGRTLGIAAIGDTVFVGNWWVLYSYRLHADRVAPNLVLGEDVNLVDFGPLAVGESRTVEVPVMNQGTAPLTLYNNWTTNEAFTVEPEEVTVPVGAVATLTVTYKAATDERETAFLNLRSDDPDYPARSAYLVANLDGLGVGKELPETKIVLLDGGDWSTAEVDEGNVLVLAYFATF